MGPGPGDPNKRVNNNEMRDIKSFKEMIKRVDVSKGVLPDIVGQKRPFYVTIRLTKEDLGAWQ